MDVNVYDALKQGDEVITDLQSKASLESFEELYDKHQDHMKQKEYEQELFGKVLDEDELMDELAQLDAENEAENLPSPVRGEIIVNPRPDTQVKANQQASKPNRQMVAA